ncbi:MAG: hypothetical protein CBC09_03905 [Cellvibrionales bacterium TMED49]|nr:hypothetical protein [Porticoccaceae bacterium]OUU38964.1 MAG: hypothetical protein CBC09_03905 [Cellvibrionales bacterium TMED49]
MFKAFRVAGDSMFPTLSHNDLVITRKKMRVRVGDIVVMNIAAYGRVVKRVKSIAENGYLRLIGDNLLERSSCCSVPQSGDTVTGTVFITIKTGCLNRYKNGWVRKLKHMRRSFQVSGNSESGGAKS